MRRAALYSSTRPAQVPAPAPLAATPKLRERANNFAKRYGRAAVVTAGALAAGLIVLASGVLPSGPRELTQEEIDAAVLHTLETKTLPSRAAKAAESIRQSVVSVRGYVGDPKEAKDDEVSGGIGTGVVIIDNGTILTNLHVVHGMRRVTVTFFDGLESEAEFVAARPESDLAVIRARTIPDDLPAATLGSTARIQPGDEVVAVGFPFGIGPSVSAGVVSGLEREFRSPQGRRVLTGLIQFDAAVNSGNSGGPLITMGGEVIGIVTALLNPTAAGTFIGIGFAATIETAGAVVGIPPF